MSVALQVAITGLAVGGVYGLVAVGYSLVFRLTGTIAFAFGDLIGLGVFATLLVAVGTGPVSQTNVGGARYAVAVAAGLVICVAVGIAGYLLYAICANVVGLGKPINLVTAAVTPTIGAGDLALKLGGFTLGGIGTATFGAILLYQLFHDGEADAPLAKPAHRPDLGAIDNERGRR